MSIAPARRAAFDLLLRIERDGAYSSVLLPQFELSLQPLDRALCHEIVLGTLRTQLWCDAEINRLASAKKLDLEIRVILRMGMFQLARLDRVPPHAVINDAVELTRHARKSSASGMVNAVLRKFDREAPQARPARGEDSGFLDVSHPEWLLKRWGFQFGRDEALAIATANNIPIENSFRTVGDGPLVETEDVGAAKLRELALEGQIYFQDKGSQLIGGAISLGPHDRFLDVCAAPGSKLTQIADRHRSGPLIIGGDVHLSRVLQTKAAIQRQGLSRIPLAVYDATETLPFADGTFDSVLVDAPCSGTGTIRNNPEIRYRLKESDFVELSKRQSAILNEASRVIRSGGKLIYSTCSLEREEDETVAETFLSSHSNFTKVRPNVPSEHLTEDGFARTLPHRDSMDGFFIAVFEKS